MHMKSCCQLNKNGKKNSFNWLNNAKQDFQKSNIKQFLNLQD